MIELYEAKVNFVDSMKENGGFMAIEDVLIELSKDFLSASLNLNTEALTEQHVDQRIIQSSRGLYIGVEQSRDLVWAKQRLINFFMDAYTEENQEEQSDLELGSLNLKGLDYQRNGAEQSVAIILNRFGLVGDIRFSATVQRDSSILGGPANIQTVIEVYDSRESHIHTTTVVKRSETTNIPAQLEALLSYAQTLEAQGIVFEDKEWSAARFDHFGSTVLVKEFLKANQHVYIDEHDMLTLSKFVADDIFDFELSDQVTFGEAINFLSPLYYYLTNTYASSLNGYNFGQRVAHSVLVAALQLAKKPEQLHLLAQRLVDGLYGEGELSMNDIPGQIESIVQELRELTCVEQVEPEYQLPVEPLMSEVHKAVAAYHDEDEEDDWY